MHLVNNGWWTLFLIQVCHIEPKHDAYNIFWHKSICRGWHHSAVCDIYITCRLKLERFSTACTDRLCRTSWKQLFTEKINNFQSRIFNKDVVLFSQILNKKYSDHVSYPAKPNPQNWKQFTWSWMIQDI